MIWWPGSYSARHQRQHGFHGEREQTVSSGIWPGNDAKGLGHERFPQWPCSISSVAMLNCGPRGGTGGVKPGSGVQRFWGPLGASEFDPSFQQFGVSETPSQRPLRAPERLSGPRERLFRGLGVFNGAGKQGGPLRGP